MTKRAEKAVDLLVGQRLRQMRASFGLSQARVGSYLGLSFSQVQKFENGANRIGAGRLYLLSKFFNVPIQYFFEDTGDPSVRRDIRSARDEISRFRDALQPAPNPDLRAR